MSVRRAQYTRNYIKDDSIKILSNMPERDAKGARWGTRRLQGSERSGTLHSFDELGGGCILSLENNGEATK